MVAENKAPNLPPDATAWGHHEVRVVENASMSAGGGPLLPHPKQHVHLFNRLSGCTQPTCGLVARLPTMPQQRTWLVRLRQAVNQAGEHG